MKKKLIPIIISVIIFLAGCASAVFGILRNNGNISSYPGLDTFRISDEDVGKTFTGSVNAQITYAFISGKHRQYCAFLWEDTGDEEDGNYIVMCFDVPKGTRDYFDNFDEGLLTFCGTVYKNDEKTEKFIQSYCEDSIAFYGEDGSEPDADALEKAIGNISPYYIEITEAANSNNYIWIGCCVMAAAVFMLLTILFGKKFLIVFAILVGIPVIVLLILFAGRLRTMLTVKKASEGLYTMTCRYDYECDKYLNADISTIDELDDWIAKELFFGLPIKFDPDNLACSAFTAGTPEGQRLFARNFDYDDTDTLVVYTEPKDGYASYSVVDLRFFDIGTENGLDGNSIPAKAMMLCAPYAPMDGINEAGVGVGILQLDIDEVHQDGGKPDLLICSAIRGILDKCASVDEAIALLENYDMHSFLECSYHLFITDKTGRSVIVEWTDSDTYIVEDNACTNDVMSENEFYDPEWKCKRYDIIKNRLSESGGILTEDEAMSVASDARRDDTQWSCVYNLDEFTLDICLDRDYESKHSFTRKDFK